MGMPSRSLKLAIDLRLSVTSGFWPVICFMRLDRLFHVLLLADGLAHAHVDHDLLQPRQREPVAAAELLGQRRQDLLVVLFLQPRDGNHFRLLRLLGLARFFSLSLRSCSVRVFGLHQSGFLA